MRFIPVTCLASLSSLVLMPFASAADMPAKAPAYKPPVVITQSWTGFYVGGNIGGGWGNRSVDYAPNDPASVALFAPATAGAPPSETFRTSGVIGGIQLGYNWQFNRNWLAGLETDFNWSDMKGSGTSGGIIGGLFPFTAPVDEHIKWFGTVRARLGYLPVDNLLLYLTGGFAYGQVEHTASYVTFGGATGANIGGFSAVCAGGGTTCLAGASTGTGVGWTVGGGLEYAIWQHWTIKGEYLFVSLDSQSVTETALVFVGGTAPSSFNANFGRTTFNVARVGVNYRF
jgi:outer membrane immunogenic protein